MSENALKDFIYIVSENSSGMIVTNRVNGILRRIEKVGGQDVKVSTTASSVIDDHRVVTVITVTIHYRATEEV